MNPRTLTHFPFAKLATLAFSLSLAGCSSTSAGVSGYDNFLQDSKSVALTGTRSAAQAARCFEEQAVFLPLSEFSRDSAEQSFTYRLRLAGVWYEQVRIEADGAGSRAESHLSPSLNDRWKVRFDADRGSVLKRCMSASAN
jgi:hypothetical protein